MSIIIVDCETYPIDNAAEYLDPLPELTPPDLDQIQPAGNVKKPELVAESIKQRQAAALFGYEQAVAAQRVLREAQIAACSKDIDLCRIVALGWQVLGDPKPTVLVCENELKERDVLEMFWREARDARLVTFHGLSFDLQVLQRRSQLLRVSYPVLNLDRYRTTHLDLYQRLTFNQTIGNYKDRAHRRGLQFYLARFGIPYDDVSTGKDIAALVKAEDWAGVAAHCAADVTGTRLLAHRLGLLHVPVTSRPVRTEDVSSSSPGEVWGDIEVESS